MRGLFAKALQEVWLSTLLFGCGMLLVKLLLTYVLPQLQAGMGGILDQIPFVKTLLSGLLGTEIGDEITARTMQSFLWVHPVVLALLWAHEIALCTRMPAGEVDRGTIDVLLGLPVSRRAVYACESCVWLASGILILVLGLLGHRIAVPAMPEPMRPELAIALLVEANLFCVYVAVGGIAFLVSAMSNRRGTAIAIVFGIVLASFLLNFVAQFWDPARQIAFLSLLQYYQPAEILQNGKFPLADASVLLLVGGTAWALGGEIVARRSLCTV